MEPVFGNHLGMVISNNDPEGRKRVQVFIPYLTNTLFADWNNKLKDVTFRTTVDLQKYGVLDRLKQTLPWAEYAAPMFGGATSVTSNSSTGKVQVNNTGTPTFAGFDAMGGVSMVDTSANSVNPNSTALLTTNNVGELPKNSSGKIDPNQLKTYLSQRLASSPLTQYNNGAGFVPSDASKYGIDGSANSWANYFTKLAEYESTFNSTEIYREVDMAPNKKGEVIKSTGLFQVSYESVRGYGIGKGLTDEELQEKLLDPFFNAEAAIAIHEQNVMKSGSVESSSGLGARYFASGTMTKIKRDVAAGKVDSFNASATTSTAIFNSQNDPKNSTAAKDNNADSSASGSPNGTVSVPNESAKVWVFFYGGDIQRPVYFASAIEGST
jgi:hypothetical protein